MESIWIISIINRIIECVRRWKSLFACVGVCVCIHIDRFYINEGIQLYYIDMLGGSSPVVLKPFPSFPTLIQGALWKIVVGPAGPWNSLCHPMLLLMVFCQVPFEEINWLTRVSGLCVVPRCQRHLLGLVLSAASGLRQRTYIGLSTLVFPPYLCIYSCHKCIHLNSAPTANIILSLWFRVGQTNNSI